MTKKSVALLLFFSTALLFRVSGQSEECVFQLQEAERLFSLGQIENIPQMLDSCIREGFTKEERLQAYKLIINTFLMDDNMMAADLMMQIMLKRYPEYEITPADPAEFVFLKNSYKTIPAFSLGVAGGGILTFPYSIEQFGIHDIANTSGDYKAAGPGFHAGISILRYLSPRFELNLEGMFQQYVYKYALSPIKTGFDNEYNVEMTETMSVLAFPFSVTFDLIKNSKWRPFLRAGILTTYYLGSTLDPIRTYSQGTFDPVTGENISTVDFNYRTEYNFYALGGAGVKYDYRGKGYFLLDLRFNAGFTSIVNGNNRLDPHGDSIFRYYYTDDDYMFNHFTFSVGWIYPIYISKKQPNIY